MKKMPVGLLYVLVYYDDNFGSKNQCCDERLQGKEKKRMECEKEWEMFHILDDRSIDCSFND